VALWPSATMALKTRNEYEYEKVLKCLMLVGRSYNKIISTSQLIIIQCYLLILIDMD